MKPSKQLLEGLSSARKQYLDTGKVSKEVFDDFVEKDSSKNNKYLDWMLARYVEDPDRATHIIDATNLFYDMAERGKIDQKDIYQYKTLEDLDAAIEKGGITKTRSELRREEKVKSEVILDTNDLFIVVPKSYEASCRYGAHTKWCTVGKERSYWDTYYKKGVKLYYIMDKKNNKKYAVAVLPSGEKEIFDEKDKSITMETLKKRLGISI